jgi:hypothetical protein
METNKESVALVQAQESRCTLAWSLKDGAKEGQAGREDGLGKVAGLGEYHNEYLESRVYRLCAPSAVISPVSVYRLLVHWAIDADLRLSLTCYLLLTCRVSHADFYPQKVRWKRTAAPGIDRREGAG